VLNVLILGSPEKTQKTLKSALNVNQETGEKRMKDKTTCNDCYNNKAMIIYICFRRIRGK